ncbi:hypothetical protein BC937DRAFT_90653, partial [Endogone sp. FLAS-F59071]
TGSETTGTAIFDYEPLHVKTGIAHRALKPLLGIVDPFNTRSMPSQIHAASGLDVLCHALESYTAIPYNLRTPCPQNPLERPAYQGANPISDVWSLHALRMTVQYLPRAVKDPEDHEAHAKMLLAATFAGRVPHGNFDSAYTICISVAVTAPSVFRFTAASSPERHLEAAQIFGADITNVTAASAGPLLSERITAFLDELGIPNGLQALGYTSADIPELVKGTLPQHRVTKLAPAGAPGEEELAGLAVFRGRSVAFVRGIGRLDATIFLNLGRPPRHEDARAPLVLLVLGEVAELLVRRALERWDAANLRDQVYNEERGGDRKSSGGGRDDPRVANTHEAGGRAEPGASPRWKGRRKEGERKVRS